MIPQDVAVYRILTNFFGPDDHLYGEGDIIQFSGIPNEEMEPLNELARKAQNAYFDQLEEAARLAAQKAGRTYTGRPKNLEEAVNMAREDARRVQLVQGGPGVPLMGANKTAAKSVIGKVSDIVEVAETGIKNKATAKGRGSLTLGNKVAEQSLV